MALRTLAIAVLALTTIMPARADCTPKELASVRLSEAHGYYTLPATVAGTTRPFILDLGSVYSYAWASVIDDLKLDRTNLPRGMSISFRGQNVTHLAHADVSVGDASENKTELLEVPQSIVTDPAVAGVLGLDFLGNFDIDLDLANDRLRLVSENSCGSGDVSWSKSFASVPLRREVSGTIQLPVRLDGKDISAATSMIGEESWMFFDVAADLFGVTKTSPGLTPTRPQWFQYPFKQLSIGSVVIEGPRIAIWDNGGRTACRETTHPGVADYGRRYTPRCYGASDLTLELPELRQLHLFFAFEERTLYATRTGTP